MGLFFQWINQSKIPSTPIHEVVQWLYKRLIDNIEAHKALLPLPWKMVANPYTEICKVHVNQQALCPETFHLLLSFIEQGIYKYFDNNGNRRDMEIPKCMYDIAEEFALASDEQQMIAFTTVCSSFLLQVLDRGIAETLFLGQTRNDELKQKVAEIKDTLHRLGAKETLTLLILITGGGGGRSDKTPLIVAARKFCHQFNKTAKVLFRDGTSFDTAHVQVDPPPDDDNITDKIIYPKSNEKPNEDWENITILFVDGMESISAKRLKELDLSLKRVKNEPYEMYGGLCIVFAGHHDAIESVRKYTLQA
jgi:hypothetical protein